MASSIAGLQIDRGRRQLAGTESAEIAVPLPPCVFVLVGSDAREIGQKPARGEENLVANGLTLLRALELSKDTTQNLFLRGKVGEVIEYVGDGGSLSKSMKRVGFFPPLLLDMVAVGEQTGQIGDSLERAAERYDKELGKDIEKISALIQPVIVVTMAILVGIMAYMMISVIFETIYGLETG